MLIHTAMSFGEVRVGRRVEIGGEVEVLGCSCR